MAAESTTTSETNWLDVVLQILPGILEQFGNSPGEQAAVQQQLQQQLMQMQMQMQMQQQPKPQGMSTETKVMLGLGGGALAIGALYLVTKSPSRRSRR